MSTFVRIKRHRSEISSDTLLLRFKKQRFNEEDDNKTEVGEVLTYAGTLDTKDAESREKIIKLAGTFPNINRPYTLDDIREKSRVNRIQNRKDRVVRIIDSFRQENDEQQCRIIHAERSPEKEFQSQDENYDVNDEYVFDVFLTSNNYATLDEFDESDIIIEEIVHDGLIINNRSDNDSDEESNAESFYGNDYLETELDVCEKDILDRIERIGLENDNDDDYENCCFDKTSGDHNYCSYKSSSSDCNK